MPCISHLFQHFSWHALIVQACIHTNAHYWLASWTWLILSMLVFGPACSEKTSVLTPYATWSLEMLLEDAHKARHFVVIWWSSLTLKRHMFCHFHCHLKRSPNSFTLVSKYSYSPLINSKGSSLKYRARVFWYEKIAYNFTRRPIGRFSNWPPGKKWRRVKIRNFHIATSNNHISTKFTSRYEYWRVRNILKSVISCLLNIKGLKILDGCQRVAKKSFIKITPNTKWTDLLFSTGLQTCQNTKKVLTIMYLFVAIFFTLTAKIGGCMASLRHFQTVSHGKWRQLKLWFSLTFRTHIYLRYTFFHLYICFSACRIFFYIYV